MNICNLCVYVTLAYVQTCINPFVCVRPYSHTSTHCSTTTPRMLQYVCVVCLSVCLCVCVCVYIYMSTARWKYCWTVWRRIETTKWPSGRTYTGMYRHTHASTSLYTHLHTCVFVSSISVRKKKSDEHLKTHAHIKTYLVAKTHRIPYLYRSFSAKETYISWLFCGKWSAI